MNKYKAVLCDDNETVDVMYFSSLKASKDWARNYKIVPISRLFVTRSGLNREGRQVEDNVERGYKVKNGRIYNTGYSNRWS